MKIIFKKNSFNKRGSFTVFAVFFFSSVVICLIAAIASARSIFIGSSIESFGSLWAKNILSEYDLKLKERYGLLCYYGDTSSIEGKINSYSEFSLKDKEYIEYEPVVCDLTGYEMTITENLADQIKMIVLQGIKPANNIKRNTSEQIQTENQEEKSSRYISSQWIINSLPSHEKTEDLYLLELIKKIKAGIGVKELTREAAIDKYIFDFFKDYMNDRNVGDTFFNCEVEYILSGELSDDRAKRAAGSKIKLVRNMLNLAYLYSCPEKRDSALTLATSLAPTAAPLTQAAILELWAYLEAENDLKILYDNKTVPLIKKDSNWALTIENVSSSLMVSDNSEEIQNNDANGTEKKDYVSPASIEGQNYKEYLAVLLCGLSEETKLLRIMDLIQVNMKFTYFDYFLLKDYYCGLNYQMKVNGVCHEFKDSY